jgi:hypothetical protein
MTAPLNALAMGDFRALLDSILSDDRIEGQVPCPCGQANDVLAVRAGVSVLTWANANQVHGVAGDIALDIAAYGSVAEAASVMDGIRAEMMQLNGMAQLINAVNGASGQQPVQFGFGPDFVII